MRTQIRNIKQDAGFYIDGVPYRAMSYNRAEKDRLCVNLKTNKEIALDGDDYCITSRANVSFSDNI